MGEVAFRFEVGNIVIPQGVVRFCQTKSVDIRSKEWNPRVRNTTSIFLLRWKRRDVTWLRLDVISGKQLISLDWEIWLAHYRWIVKKIRLISQHRRYDRFRIDFHLSRYKKILRGNCQTKSVNFSFSFLFFLSSNQQFSRPSQMLQLRILNPCGLFCFRLYSLGYLVISCWTMEIIPF